MRHQASVSSKDKNKKIKLSTALLLASSRANIGVVGWCDGPG